MDVHALPHALRRLSAGLVGPGRSSLATLAWTLLPPRCLLCGFPAAGRLDLCDVCRSDLPGIPHPCATCGLPLAAATALGRCGPCLRRPPPLDAIAVRCRYADPADLLVRALKFEARTAAARVMAALMLETAPTLPPGATLVPVPLHRMRRWRRGFDQAERLARHLADGAGVPLAPALLRRVRATTPQTGLGRGARRRNLAGAFALGPGPAPETVVLVDDVLTTGATLAAAARTLRRAGVRSVRAWVFARTPAGGQRRAGPG